MKTEAGHTRLLRARGARATARGRGRALPNLTCGPLASRLLFKSPSLWHFVVAALVNEHKGQQVILWHVCQPFPQHLSRQWYREPGGAPLHAHPSSGGAAVNSWPVSALAGLVCAFFFPESRAVVAQVL